MTSPTGSQYVNHPNEIGMVAEKTFAYEESFLLSSGEKLEGFQLRYECYGELNKEKDNAIYVCHALTGDHHVAGVYSEEDEKPGWWNHVVGPVKPIDTNRFLFYHQIAWEDVGGRQVQLAKSQMRPIVLLVLHFQISRSRI